MAYNQSTGAWQYEDDSVSKQITGLLSKDNPLFQQAGTNAKKAANRRGLANSTMAVQAGQEALINAALPIASQDAQQIAQKNLQRQGFGEQVGVIGAQGEQQRLNIGAQGTEDRANIGAQGEQQRLNIGAQGTEDRANIGAQGEQERLNIGSRSDADVRSIETQGAQQRQTNEADFGYNQQLQAADLASREEISNLDRQSRDRIADLPGAAHDREKATSAAVAMENSYAEIFRTIAQAHELPAATRDAYLKHVTILRESNLNLVEQLYNIDLQFATPTPTGDLPPGVTDITNPSAPTPTTNPDGPPYTTDSTSNFSPEKSIRDVYI
ncbi:MAG: hypothetical protein VW338_18645 [Rhodospirillaceae bacterium]